MIFLSYKAKPGPAGPLSGASILIFCLASCLLAPAFLSCGAGSGAAERRTVQVYAWDGGEEEIVLENGELLLRFIPRTTETILIHKATGVEWRSNPPGGAEDPKGIAVTRQLLQSQFSLTFADTWGVTEVYSSFNECVKNGQYEYALKNGGLEVSYYVAKAELAYRFPPAAPESRMKLFLDQMPPADRAKVEGAYTVYSLETLPISGTPSKGYLLRIYPDVIKERMYVIKTNTPEYLKADMAEIFQAARYTAEDFEEDLARYSVQNNLEGAAFNLTIRYELQGGALLVSVPFDRIAYRQSFPLTRLNLLPYFGSGGIEDEGYLLVPDGAGALIHFNNGRETQQAYNMRIYGRDQGMPAATVISETAAPFPAFGIEKNGAALLAVIEEGASYASITADVSGRNSSWNRISPEFVIVNGGRVDVSGRSEADRYTMYRYEAALPGERLLLRFTPCTEDGYVGMAKAYRSYLLGKYPQLGQGQRGDVPVAVEILGAVEKSQHILGILLDMPFALTTYKETEGMIRDFGKWGWKGALIKLTGWFSGGVDHRVPAVPGLISELGSGADFQGLLAAASGAGYRVYGEADFVFLRKDGPFDGLDLNRDIGRFVTRDRIKILPISPVYFTAESQNTPSYVARPGYTEALVRGFADKAAGMGLKGLAFRSIGSKLAADYRENDPVSREASARRQGELLAELRDKGSGTMISAGYGYALPWADLVTGMALTSQEFGIADTEAPFFQIALHGLVPYTGQAINLAEDYTKHLLKTIETGAGLYFSFMTRDGSVLQETGYMRYYSNEYRKWAAEADGLYQRFVRDFTGLYNQTIEDHEIIAPGVTVTHYSGGARVAVNAGKIPISYGGNVIAPKSYAVIR